MTGTVKCFNDTKVFGFITPNDGGEDLFAHQSSIRTEGLTPGDSVEFQIDSDFGGRTKANDVTATEEGPVQGMELLNYSAAVISLFKQMVQCTKGTKKLHQQMKCGSTVDAVTQAIMNILNVNVVALEECT